MKAGKARGPSGIVVEVILAAGDVGASVIWQLQLSDGKVPSNWEQRVREMHWTGATTMVSTE